MMLIVPILSGKEGSSPLNIIFTLGTAVLAIAAIIFTARILVPRALDQIVQLRSPEVFIIFIVLVSLGTAWITSQFGLSLALGAFIAGLVLSESEYSHQIVADILPFRDVFNSLFFVSIGMLLSVSFLMSHVITVLIWVVALIIGKAIVAIIAVRVMGNSLRVAIIAGLGIAQIGEFSFILAKMGLDQQLIVQDDYQTFLSASVLSMIATPFLIKAAPRIGYAIQSRFSPHSMLEMGMIGNMPTDEIKAHVVIVGYGLNGRNVSKVLSKVGIPYKILDLNAGVVRWAASEGEPILYGDSTRREVMHYIHFEQARVLVIAISDPIATRRTVALAREMNHDINIIVRTRYMSELPDLYRLGANQVIPEEFETSIEIFSRVLREYGIARNVIQREVDEIRHEGYEILRLPAQPHIEVSEIAEALGTASTETLFIESSWPIVGQTLGDIDLRKRTRVTVIAAIRDGDSQINPGPDYCFQAEDILVLMGSPQEIETAIELISASDLSSARQ
jgi:CPA2 family monovalent cation:H+ antiporter-2